MLHDTPQDTDTAANYRPISQSSNIRGYKPRPAGHHLHQERQTKHILPPPSSHLVATLAQ